MRTISDRSSEAPTSRGLGLPAASGMYDPRHERDSCGLAMVATTRGTAGHDIVALALDALRNLEHRGAVGSDAGTGDGAGILTQMPDAFLRAVAGFELPAPGTYAAGLAFLPLDASARAAARERIEEIAGQERLRVLGWREVPTVPDALGKLARGAMPAIEQLFVTAAGTPVAGLELDRLAWRLRKRIEREVGEYLPSLSSRTITYKGMVTTLQLEPFYPDLSDERFETKLAIVHSRYSTNTFPSWPLAQPLRMIAHNGEINTVEGNRNWMRARESQLASELLGDLRPLKPIVTPGHERLHLVRRGARAAHARRALAAARDHDDGAAGVGEPGRHAAGPAGLRRVPLAAHGAVGRAGRHQLHRRHRRRRDPRPQRPAPGALAGDLRRARRARERDGRAADRAEPRRPARPAAAGQALPRRHRGGPARPRRGDQAGARLDGAVGGVARVEPHPPRRPARPRARRAHRRIRRPPPAHLRLHRGGGADPHRADGEDRCRAARRDGLRHPDRRALEPAAAAVRLLQAGLRAGDEPAARQLAGVDRDEHVDGHRPGAQPAHRRRRPTRARSSSTSR